jgi:hypothetical protein
MNENKKYKDLVARPLFERFISICYFAPLQVVV